MIEFCGLCPFYNDINLEEGYCALHNKTAYGAQSACSESQPWNFNIFKKSIDGECENYGR